MYKDETLEHSPISLKTVRVEALNHKRETIGGGSGFWFMSPDHLVGYPDDFVEDDSPPRVSLVTNFHVVAGKSWEDGSWTNGCHQDRMPFFLKVYLSAAVEYGTDRESLDSFVIPLLIGEPGEIRQNWYSKYPKSEDELRARPSAVRHKYLGPDHQGDYPTYPVGGVLTDIAVVPMSDEKVREFKLREVAWEWDRRLFSDESGQRIGVRPTDTVYVLGYPDSVEKFSPTMPTWTTGSVATEVNMGPKERFFIDSRTRPGQSGSPVIFYRRERYLSEGGLGAKIPEAAALLGIYSGRTNAASDIGSVWWADEIENIHKNIHPWPN